MKHKFDDSKILPEERKMAIRLVELLEVEEEEERRIEELEEDEMLNSFGRNNNKNAW